MKIEFSYFMRIPFIAAGVLVTKHNLDDVARWCLGHVITPPDGDDEPFVRVPVLRPTHENQTKAYPGTWVIATEGRDGKAYKVYNETWLRKQFQEVPVANHDMENTGELPSVVTPRDNPSPGETTKDLKGRMIPQPPSSNVQPLPTQRRGRGDRRHAR